MHNLADFARSNGIDALEEGLLAVSRLGFLADEVLLRCMDPECFYFALLDRSDCGFHIADVLKQFLTALSDEAGLECLILLLV